MPSLAEVAQISPGFDRAQVRALDEGGRDVAPGDVGAIACKLPLPPGTHVIFGLSYFMAVVTCRAVLYQVVNAIYRRAQPRCRVLIYGAGATGSQLATALKAIRPHVSAELGRS